MPGDNTTFTVFTCCIALGWLLSLYYRIIDKCLVVN